MGRITRSMSRIHRACPAFCGPHILLFCHGHFSVCGRDGNDGRTDDRCFRYNRKFPVKFRVFRFKDPIITVMHVVALF